MSRSVQSANPFTRTNGPEPTRLQGAHHLYKYIIHVYYGQRSLGDIKKKNNKRAILPKLR